MNSSRNYLRRLPTEFVDEYDPLNPTIDTSQTQEIDQQHNLTLDPAQYHPAPMEPSVDTEIVNAFWHLEGGEQSQIQELTPKVRLCIFFM